MTSIRSVTWAALRIAAGVFFMLHGGQKLLGWFGGIDGSGGTVAIGSMMGVAGVIELVGGALLALGLLTRPAAFLMAGEMAVAYFMQHFPNGFWPIQNRGETAALYCFIFLFFMAHGAGRFSLDAAIQRRPREIDRETHRRVPAHAH